MFSNLKFKDSFIGFLLSFYLNIDFKYNDSYHMTWHGCLCQAFFCWRSRLFL